MVKNQIIFLNGTSGAGKSTLATALQNNLEQPFWHMASDKLIAANLLPKRDFEGGKFNWKLMRPKFFKAFHNCLPVIVQAGNNIIIDHIIETEAWKQELQILLKDMDVFFVGVHCDLEELRNRENARIGNSPNLKRYIGETEYHLKTHDFCSYDFEVDTTTISSEENALKIIEAMKINNGVSKFFLNSRL